MEVFDLLGCGHATISIIGDILLKIYNGEILIRIIKNVEDNDTRPFKLKRINYEEINFNDWDPLEEIRIFPGIMNVKPKQNVYEFFNRRNSIDFERYCNLIHPDISLAENVVIRNGILICAGTVIGPFTEIENMVTINRNASIGHHTKICNFCTINPGVNIAGDCEIGEGVTIGMGANIFDGIKIGEKTIVGAGSLVNQDLPENVIAYGSPARVKSEVHE